MADFTEQTSWADLSENLLWLTPSVSHLWSHLSRKPLGLTFVLESLGSPLWHPMATLLWQHFSDHPPWMASLAHLCQTSWAHLSGHSSLAIFSGSSLGLSSLAISSWDISLAIFSGYLLLGYSSLAIFP